MAWVSQQRVREDRGEVLQRHRRSKADDRRLGCEEGKALLDPRLQPRHVVARLRHATIEGKNLAHVRHLPLGERLDFGSEPIVGAIAETPHRVDEKRLTAWEGDGERIIDRGLYRVATHPPADGCIAPAEPPVTWGDDKIARRAH